MPIKCNLKDFSFKPGKLKTPGYGLANNVNPKAKIPSTQFKFEPRLLPPKSFSFPYHFHRHAEELFLVLEGTMELRTPKGIELLKKGDLVFFEKGPESAHQLYNPGTKPCLYMDLRMLPGFDLIEYPDSGKILVDPDGGIYRKSSAVNYFDGENEPLANWMKQKAAKKVAGKKIRKTN